MYSFHLLSAAIEDLAKLDKSVARIGWLAENFEFIKHEALKGDLSGLYKFRAGNYRIVYEIFEEEKLITIHSVGHRREVYKRR